MSCLCFEESVSVAVAEAQLLEHLPGPLGIVIIRDQVGRTRVRPVPFHDVRVLHLTLAPQDLSDHGRPVGTERQRLADRLAGPEHRPIVGGIEVEVDVLPGRPHHVVWDDRSIGGSLLQGIVLGDVEPVVRGDVDLARDQAPPAARRDWRKKRYSSASSTGSPSSRRQ